MPRIGFKTRHPRCVTAPARDGPCLGRPPVSQKGGHHLHPLCPGPAHSGCQAPDGESRHEHLGDLLRLRLQQPHPLLPHFPPVRRVQSEPIPSQREGGGDGANEGRTREGPSLVGLQHPTPNAQHPTPNAQRPTPNAQHPVPSLIRLICLSFCSVSVDDYGDDYG